MVALLFNRLMMLLLMNVIQNKYSACQDTQLKESVSNDERCTLAGCFFPPPDSKSQACTFNGCYSEFQRTKCYYSSEDFVISQYGDITTTSTAVPRCVTRSDFIPVDPPRWICPKFNFFVDITDYGCRPEENVEVDK